MLALESRKPFPIIKPKIHRPRRKRVTIATGFTFDDGLLFCADTKITTDVKTNESKLSYLDYGSGQCATTFAVAASDLDFARYAIEDCQEAVERIRFADEGVSIETVRKAIQSALAKFYKEHIFPRPDRSADADFDLLIGIWLRGETRMFVSHETIVSAVEGYECVGTGAYLAKYWIRKFLAANRGPMSLEDAALIATYAVKSALEYDESCGGEAEVLIMRANGDMGNHYETAVYPGDELPEKLQSEMWRLLRDLAHVTDNMEVETSRLLEDYFERIRKINRSYQWWFESRARLKQFPPEP